MKIILSIFPEIRLSNVAIYEFILAGIALFFFFRFIKFIVPLVLKRKNNRKSFLKYLPVIELFLWLMFFIWWMQFFVVKNQFFAIGMSILLIITALWISWFLLRDYISGVILRISGNISLRQTIIFEDYKGMIIKLKNRTLELETEDSKHIIVPYSIILNKVITRAEQEEKVAGHSFNIITNKDKKLADKINEIRTSIIYLPWSSIKREPNIKPIGEQPDSFNFTVTVYSLEKEYFYRIENYVKEKFEIKS